MCFSITAKYVKRNGRLETASTQTKATDPGFQDLNFTLGQGRRTKACVAKPLRWAALPTCSRSVSDRRSKWRANSIRPGLS
ncbi:MAG: hypothetical protein RMY29_028765 [Nostoc sp. CreGUA01]